MHEASLADVAEFPARKIINRIGKSRIWIPLEA